MKFLKSLLFLTLTDLIVYLICTALHLPTTGFLPTVMQLLMVAGAIYWVFQDDIEDKKIDDYSVTLKFTLAELTAFPTEFFREATNLYTPHAAGAHVDFVWTGINFLLFAVAAIYLIKFKKGAAA